MSRAHQDAPPRRPPPPPRPPHHATAARPAAAAAWPPLAPPRPPLLMARPPPLPMRPWPPAPPRFPMRPPMQHAPRHHPRPPPPVFPRFVPPYRPSLPSQDPDASWLAAFAGVHLHAAPVTDTPSTSDPPLRPIRERLGEMLSKLDELEALAHELVDTEQKILTMDSSTDDLVVARLKAQAERKHHQCEQLRGALDKLQDPKPFGIGPEKYRDTLAFTKHIQKKEAYRLRRKEKGRAEHTIRQRLQNQHETKKNEEVLLPVPEEADTLGHAVDDTPMEAVDGQQRDDGRVVSTRRDRRRECEAARKVLLALDLRELRKGSELTERERHEIDEARGLATECLRRKRRRKRRRASKTRDTDTAPPLSPTLVSSVGVGFPRPSHGLPLRDPFATDMETLIDLRRRWDFFLAPSTVHGASAIPPHFVPPPTNPTAPWAAFIVQ